MSIRNKGNKAEKEGEEETALNREDGKEYIIEKRAGDRYPKQTTQFLQYEKRNKTMWNLDALEELSKRGEDQRVEIETERREKKMKH